MGRKAAKRRARKEVEKQSARLDSVVQRSEQAGDRAPEGSLHEAVHAVAAAVLMGADQIANVTVAPGLGLPGGSLELVDDPELSAAGAAETPLEELPATLTERAHGRLVMHLAGTFDGDIAGARSIDQPHAHASDRSNAHELALLLADWEEAGTAPILASAGEEARAFVREHQPEIRAVALALDLRRTLTGPDVAEILSGLGGRSP